MSKSATFCNICTLFVPRKAVWFLKALSDNALNDLVTFCIGSKSPELSFIRQVEILNLDEVNHHGFLQKS